MAEVYTVIVVASDSGVPPRSSSGTFTVDVAAPNFDDPQFDDDDLDDLMFSITENDPSVSFSFEVTDTDDGLEGEVLFELLPSQYSDNFTITQSPRDSSNRTMGTISYTGGPGFDREVVRNFTLLVRATDQGNVLFRRSTDAELFVSIEDVNDNRPEFVGAPLSARISENAAVGTSVTTVTAVDPDEGTNAAITYSLGLVGSNFRIDENSGEISVDDSLMELVHTPITLPVVASDGLFTTTENIIITIIDENDNTPQFTPAIPPTLSIPEDTEVGATLLNISVTDEDTGPNGEATLFIGQEGSTFTHSSPEINEFSIILNEELDAEVSETSKTTSSVPN